VIDISLSISVYTKCNYRPTTRVVANYRPDTLFLPFPSLLLSLYCYARPIGQAIIFCSCGFFLLSFDFFLFSSPILSGRILYVYHNSTYDTAVVRISNACLKYAARGSLGIQDAEITQKNRHLRTIAQLCRAIGLSSQLKHVSTIGKNLLNSNICSTCPHSTVNFGSLRPWFHVKIKLF